MSVDRTKRLRLAKEAAESEQQSQANWERVLAKAREDRDREDEAWLPDPSVIHRLAEEAATNKQRHAFVKHLSGLAFGFRGNCFFSAPSTVSPSKLVSKRDRRLFDCCVKEGYQTSIEVDRLPNGKKPGGTQGTIPGAGSSI